ncbi:MAG: riboflavin synthase [Heliobacteriaceae bacterium]|jgi:riboflavin synthase|nr:riboflavin synthase [Heliobacteriaceae bacterium]
MFTGIVEETGFIKRFTDNTIEVECRTVLDGTKTGDSIAVNGCCQTVAAISTNSFTANVSPETLRVTNLGAAHRVNLERALTLSTRLGGHLVTGHIDCTGVFTGKTKTGDFYELNFEVPQEFSKLIVYKGSITVNGISLTVAAADRNIFTAAIIPHTYENTNLKDLKTNGIVNIETDLIGKYVEKFLCADNNKINGSIDLRLLAENGFL